MQRLHDLVERNKWIVFGALPWSTFVYLLRIVEWHDNDIHHGLFQISPPLGAVICKWVESKAGGWR